MRLLKRPALSQDTQRHLQEKTDKITQSVNPTDEARRLWAQKRGKAFDEIETALKRMAPGLGDEIAYCMYCEGDTGTDIDHFWPKSLCPCRAFTWDNYLWSCSTCNSNFKRTQFPLDDNQPLLIDPSADDPQSHMIFVASTGYFFPTTAKGRCTVEILGLNRTGRPERRKSAFVGLQTNIIAYDSAITNNDHSFAQQCRDSIQNVPFGFMLGWLLQVATSTQQYNGLHLNCRDALSRRPEIQTW